jgi:hypothetical protein
MHCGVLNEGKAPQRDAIATVMSVKIRSDISKPQQSCP